MSKQEDIGRPEKPLEKMREIDNEARISKKAEMNRKSDRNQKQITLWDKKRLCEIFQNNFWCMRLFREMPLRSPIKTISILFIEEVISFTSSQSYFEVNFTGK